MTALAFIRHGPTEWTESERIQGRADVPLSEAGRARVAAWRLPPEVGGFVWVSSPLCRATETARLLGARRLTTEPRLAEMQWGAWEGRRYTDLRRELGAAFRKNEALGLDFRPDGGESPRQVQDRLRPWLVETAGDGRPTIAVTHNGVIRAALALATGWDMTGPPPQKPGSAAAHLFRLDGDGAIHVDRLNIGLEAS